MTRSCSRSAIASITGGSTNEAHARYRYSFSRRHVVLIAIALPGFCFAVNAAAQKPEVNSC